MQLSIYRRSFLILIIGVLHLGVFYILTQNRPRTIARDRSIQLINITSPQPSLMKPIFPASEVIVVDNTITAPSFDIEDTPATPSTPSITGDISSGDGCDLSEIIQTALRNSDDAHAALNQMPRQARSVADALMLWDGHWTEAAKLGGAVALNPIRDIVIEHILAVTIDCRDALVVGPRLLFIANDNGTRVLAFGSGTWSWSELLDL